MKNSMLFIASLLVAASFQQALCINFSATNTAASTDGGRIYESKIGNDYAKNVLQNASNFILGIFNEGERKNVEDVSLFIDDMGGVAYTSGAQIHVSARYIASYNGDLISEFTGVLYHEMTHVLQWNGQGNAPGGLIEGIADYVRLKANYIPSHWVKPGQGDRWDQGYDVTARFLEYCDSLRSDFVASLNARLRGGYSDGFFSDLLGKGVNQVWNDYKAKFSG